MRSDPLGLMRLLSLLLAMILMILPLPWVASIIWPNWVMLVLFIWLMKDSRSFNLITVWLVGLFADLLLGSPLGLHALCYTLMAYIIVRWYRQIQHFPTWQQTLLFAGCILVSLLITDVTRLIIGVQCDIWQSLSVLTTALLWPWAKLLS